MTRALSTACPGHTLRDLPSLLDTTSKDWISGRRLLGRNFTSNSIVVAVGRHAALSVRFRWWVAW
jgi:hypothetical protein